MSEEQEEASNGGSQAARVVSIIAEAMRYTVPDGYSRQRAGSYPVTASEGLALLSAFISIEDAHVRQAFLDAIVAASAGSEK